MATSISSVFILGIASLATGFALALCSGVLGGGFSLGIDLDHVLYLIAKGIPITWENLRLHSSRFLHIPWLVISFIIFIGTWAYLTRLYLEG